MGAMVQCPRATSPSHRRVRRRPPEPDISIVRDQLCRGSSLEPAAPAPMSWAEAEISSMIFEIHDLNIEAGNDVAFCHCLTSAVEQKQTAKKRLRGCARPSVIARQTDTGWSCINIGRRLLTWS